MQNDETHELCHKDTVEPRSTGKYTSPRSREMWVRKARTQPRQLGLAGLQRGKLVAMSCDLYLTSASAYLLAS